MKLSNETTIARCGLDDTTWASLLPCLYGLRGVWKKDEGALRRFLQAVLWVLRTGAPWRDLPARLGKWAGVYHR